MPLPISPRGTRVVPLTSKEPVLAAVAPKPPTKAPDSLGASRNAETVALAERPMPEAGQPLQREVFDAVNAIEHRDAANDAKAQAVEQAAAAEQARRAAQPQVVLDALMSLQKTPQAHALMDFFEAIHSRHGDAGVLLGDFHNGMFTTIAVLTRSGIRAFEVTDSPGIADGDEKLYTSHKSFHRGLGLGPVNEHIVGLDLTLARERLEQAAAQLPGVASSGEIPKPWLRFTQPSTVAPFSFGQPLR
jgi:hypothetical protein